MRTPDRRRPKGRTAAEGQRTGIDSDREFIDGIPGLAWSDDPDGAHQFFNRRWLEYVGLPKDRRKWNWRAPIHPADSQRVSQIWTELLHSGEPAAFEARLRSQDGAFRWFLFHVAPRRSNAGELVGWCGIATDIEDRKRTECLHAAEMQMLRLVTEGASLTEVLNHVCTAIDLQVSPSITTILLMDPDGQKLWPAAGPRVHHEWRRAISPVPVSHIGLCSSAAFLKTRIVVPDVATEPIWPDERRDIALRCGVRSAWSQPILTKDNEVLGTFAVYSPEPRIPTDDDLALIEAAGHVALVAIERQRSHEALTSALADVRRSETELRRMTDAVAQSIVVLNTEGGVIYANRVALEYTGLTPEEVRADRFRERVFHPDDVARLRDSRQRGLAGAVPFDNEQRVLGTDGQYRWFLIKYNPMVDDCGRVTCWYATGTDIEDRKRAENKLRQEERELRQLIDLLPQHVLVLDKDGSLLQANRTMLDYKGCTLEDMKAAGTRERISRDVHPEDLERVQNERRIGLSRGAPFELEKRLLGKNGQFRWFLFRYNPVVNDEGDLVRWFATATDIEDRKQASERMRNETVALREDIVRSSMLEDIVGSSPALRRVMAQVDKVAPTDSTVLILGETGTGKELIARAIHNRSKRAARAFVTVNCAAIPPSLIASELFGHEKGAFTGAIQRRVGRFESAEGGTLFLDEVGELPAETQVALLRVLQARTFERVGGHRPVTVDVRVLAATNRDMDAAIADGSFREDLFYRLNVFPIHLPALRERTGDVALLVEYLVERYAQKAGKKFRSISNETLELFTRYKWPGNVRELQNVIERAVILSEGDTFSVDASWLAPARSKARERATLASDLAAREKTMIEQALREASGRVAGTRGAAARLGMPRQTLESKLKRFGIDRYRFRSS